MKNFKLLTFLFCLLPLVGFSQVKISAIATPSRCTNSGTIDITVTNAPGNIKYGIVKSPYDEDKIIVGNASLFTLLEPGDYFYGYFEGDVFIKADDTVRITSSFSSSSPTVISFFAVPYMYCQSGPDPLGDVSVTVSGGNAPYIFTLLNALNNSVVQSMTATTATAYFRGVNPGSFKVKVTDACNTTVTPTTIITLAPNVQFSDFSMGTANVKNGNFIDIVYNIPNDICSGIKSASIKNGIFATILSTPYIINPLGYTFYGGSNFIYKLEIQNGSKWEVYDNLTSAQAVGSFSLPADRSKWGVVRMSATLCNVTHYVELDFGASSLGKPLPFTAFSFRISDDPAVTNCIKTGKVALSRESLPTGCLPYKLEVKENGTSIVNTYLITLANFNSIYCMLDIGKKYTIKLTDNNNTELENYIFGNSTSNTSPIKPSQTDPNNIFIDPATFAAKETVSLKDQVKFFQGPSVIFGKSSLAMSVPTGTSGLIGNVSITLISGPSPLALQTNNSNHGLGNNLLQGDYKIRVRDSECFDEIYDVKLDSYFTKIELTNVSYSKAPACDRYIKSGNVVVSAEGTGKIDTVLGSIYGYLTINVCTVAAPAGVVYYYSTGSTYLIGSRGTFPFTFLPEIAGNYEIGLARNFSKNEILPRGSIMDNTVTVNLAVTPNYPVFDLSKSGGAICPGYSTGSILVKVDNADESVTYFIKKDTDADYGAGQSSPIFTDLPPGKYTIKAAITCYSVLLPLELKAASAVVIEGKLSYCAGEKLQLKVIIDSPVRAIKWTLPNNNRYTGANLYTLPAQNGTYKVDIESFEGCHFLGEVQVAINNPASPTGDVTQSFCSEQHATIADLKTRESDVIWYDALTGGMEISPSRLLENKTYYGALKAGECESIRLPVTVIIEIPSAPTGITPQEFCNSQKTATVADLKTSEKDVIWYDSTISEIPLPLNTLLVNGNIYYAALRSEKCQNNRLEIKVILTVTLPPTGNTTPVYCSSANATVADLKMNEATVVWYESDTSVTALPLGTALINNKIYYGAVKENNCESTRSAVRVTIEDSAVFDLSKSGGIICPGSLKGNIFVKLDNAVGDVTYFIKKETDPDNGYSSGQSGTIFTGYTAGNYVVKAVTGCGEILAHLKLLPAPDIKIMGNTTYCLDETLELEVIGDNQVASIKWTLPDGSTKDGRKLIITPVTAADNGSYLMVIESQEGCYFSMTVDVVIDNPSTPTGDDIQHYCDGLSTVADLRTVESGVIWYDAIIGGTKISPSKLLENNKIYYGALRNGSCESAIRLPVTAIIGIPLPPRGADVQSFCTTQNAAIGDLQTTESGVIWYDALTGGTELSPSALLINNKIYYGVVRIESCESERLAVKVRIENPIVPTGNMQQSFCDSQHATVADLKTNEPGVVWYENETGLNALSPATTLIDGATYYGALKSGICESSRFAVNVNVTVPLEPTGNISQEFCSSENATIADLKVNEAGVVWYGSATSTTALPLSMVLVNNKMYYGALKTGACEGARLAVKVSVRIQVPIIFDLSKSGGIICKDDAKGNLYIEVSKIENATYFIKKDIDTDFGAGQSSPLFTDLAAGKYIVRVVTACDSKEQLLELKPYPAVFIEGKLSYCEGEKLQLKISVESQIKSATWTLADNSRYTGATLYTIPAQKGIYKVDIESLEGCHFLSEVQVVINNPASPTGDVSQSFCSAEHATIADLKTRESDVIWYDAIASGMEILPSTLLENKTYYGALKAGGCESSRLAVTAIIEIPTAPTGITLQEFCNSQKTATVANLKTTENGIIWYNSGASQSPLPLNTLLVDGNIYYAALQSEKCQDNRLAVKVAVMAGPPPTGNTTPVYCSSANATVADLKMNEAAVMWYESETSVTALPVSTALVNDKIYYGAVKENNCESRRSAVRVNIVDSPVFDLTKSGGIICPGSSTGTLFVKLDNAAGDVTYFIKKETDPDNMYSVGQSRDVFTGYTEGNYVVKAVTACGEMLAHLKLLSAPDIKIIGNTTYCLDETLQLEVIGDNQIASIKWILPDGSSSIGPKLTRTNLSSVYSGSYLVIIESQEGCYFSIPMDVVINDLVQLSVITPQIYCITENATVADLKATGTGVIWYDSEISLTALSPELLLQNLKTYYAAVRNGDCKSTRWPVTVNIKIPIAPTGKNIQSFCRVQNAVIADLKTNEPDVMWYSDAIGGTEILPSIPLENKTYYGELKTGSCAGERLAVNVILTNPIVPTGENLQSFCIKQNAVVADLKTNESDIFWYETQTSINALSSSLLLENNKTYYGAIKNKSCEGERFAVTVTLKKDSPIKIFGWEANVCIEDTKVYTTAEDMSDYKWIIKGGTIISGGTIIDNFISIKWTAIGTGTISVTYTDKNSCNATISDYPVNVSNCPIIKKGDIRISKEVNEKAPVVGENVEFTILASNIGDAVFNQIDVSEILPSGYDYVSSYVSSGNYSFTVGLWTLKDVMPGEIEKLTIIAKVLDKGNYLNTAYLQNAEPIDENSLNNRSDAFVDPVNIIIYNAISLNNDSSNDYLKIDGLGRFPENSIEIYNRWGVKVYETENYGSNGNFFRGYSEGRATIDKSTKLPAGTYFYIFKYENLSKVSVGKSGYLYIK